MSEPERTSLFYHAPSAADRSGRFDRRNSRHADCIMWGAGIGGLAVLVLGIASAPNVFALLGGSVAGTMVGGTAGIVIGFVVRCFVR